MTLGLCPDTPCLIAKARRFGLQLRIANHLLDVTKTVRPVPEIITRNGSRWRGGPLEKLVESSWSAAGKIASCSLPTSSLRGRSRLCPAGVLLAQSPAAALPRPLA